MNRVGQVWWARRHRVKHDFEPCLVVGTRNNSGGSGVWWVMQPLERLGASGETFGSYESVFRHVEAGGDDAWLKSRIA
jgi:hypothetical protein